MEKISDNVSENHRRAISVRLAALDDALNEFDAWANGAERHSVFSHENNHLTEEQRGALKRQIGELRELLVRMKDDLELTVQESSVGQSIWARCSFLWDTLSELEPRHLKQYGAVPQPLASYLDPKVADIVTRVEAISDTVKK